MMNIWALSQSAETWYWPIVSSHLHLIPFRWNKLKKWPRGPGSWMKNETLKSPLSSPRSWWVSWERDSTCNSVIQSCWQKKLFIKWDLVCECVQFILLVIVIRATLSANFPITRFIVSSQKENAVGTQKQSEAYPLISTLWSTMVFVWATTWIIGHWQTLVRWLWGSWMYMSGRKRRNDNWDMMDLFHQVLCNTSDGRSFRGEWVWLKIRSLRLTAEGNKRYQYWKPFTAEIYQTLMTDLFFGR